MHIACMASKQECVRILILNGGNIKIENKEGFSPADIS